MQLSKKPNTFYDFFIECLKSTLNAKRFEKKLGPTSLSICDIIGSKRSSFLIV